MRIHALLFSMIWAGNVRMSQIHKLVIAIHFYRKDLYLQMFAHLALGQGANPIPSQPAHSVRLGRDSIGITLVRFLTATALVSLDAKPIYHQVSLKVDSVGENKQSSNPSPCRQEEIVSGPRLRQCSLDRSRRSTAPASIQLFRAFGF